MAKISNTERLIDFMERNDFKNALEVLRRLIAQKKEETNFKLLRIYCQIELNELLQAKRNTSLLINQLENKDLVIDLKNKIDQKALNPNPLESFKQAYINYLKSDLSTLNETDFNKLIHQILVKPYIK